MCALVNVLHYVQRRSIYTRARALRAGPIRRTRSRLRCNEFKLIYLRVVSRPPNLAWAPRKLFNRTHIIYIYFSKRFFRVCVYMYTFIHSQYRTKWRAREMFSRVIRFSTKAVRSLFPQTTIVQYTCIRYAHPTRLRVSRSTAAARRLNSLRVAKLLF